MMQENMENIGGITFSDVIAFQLRLMFGEGNYTRIANSKEEKDIIIACLKLASNDAFRHVTKNKLSGDKEIKEFLTEKKWKSLDAYICEKILPDVCDTYIEYVNIKDTASRMKYLYEKTSALCKVYEDLKETGDSEKALCFGHFQKMFNMATKNYLCLYMCRSQLEQALNITLPMGQEITPEALATADCPVDSYILGALEKDGKASKPTQKYTDIRWSKLGTQQYPIEYENVQKTIETLCKEGESKLAYDFHRWNIR